MTTKYAHVAEVLAERIMSRRFPPESFLPSERVLSAEFDVSRITIRLGMDRLKKLRLVESFPGKGYKVLGPERKDKVVRSHFVGGLFAGGRNEATTGPMSDALSGVLEKGGFHFAYSSSSGLLAREIVKIRSLLDKGMDGLIIQPAFKQTPGFLRRDDIGNHVHFKQLFDSGIPIVLVDRSCGAHGVPCVCNDDRAGGHMATDYLIQRGHRRVVFFGGTTDRIGRLRHQGYLDAMADHNLAPSSFLINDIPLTSLLANDGSVLRATRRLLDSLRKETAVMTFGFFPFNLERLTRAPDYRGPPVEWIGYDIGPADAGCHVPFPFVRRPMAEIGYRVAQKIMALIRGEKAATTEEFVKPKIVEPGEGVEG